jgi:hypothetical protein
MYFYLVVIHVAFNLRYTGFIGCPGILGSYHKVGLWTSNSSLQVSQQEQEISCQKHLAAMFE